MLTIENFQRLKGKVIGITGYYVESIKPVGLLDMNSTKQGHLYMIELTNRKQSLLVSLNRESEMVNGLRLYEMTLGASCKQTITKYELRNMNKVVDKLTKLVLEQYVP